MNTEAINIYYNGASLSLVNGTCLQDVINNNANQATPFATAVNGQVVSRSHYVNLILQDGDIIDVVSPIAGG